MRVRVTLGDHEYFCNTEHEAAALLTGVALASGHSGDYAQRAVDRVVARLHSTRRVRTTIEFDAFTPALDKVTVQRLEDRRAG